MTFRGEDYSIVDCEGNSFHLYYDETAKHGLQYKDIKKYDISLTEHMWIYNLHTTYAEALDLMYVYEAEEVEPGKLEAVYRLKSDRERYKMLKENIEQLLSITLYGYECSYALISQAQKHLHRLEVSIANREALINSEVYDLNCTTCTIDE